MNRTVKRRVKRAVAERRERLLRHLKTRVWPNMPKQQLGRRLTRDEEDAILGYGPERHWRA